MYFRLSSRIFFNESNFMSARIYTVSAAYITRYTRIKRNIAALVILFCSFRLDKSGYHRHPWFRAPWSLGDYRGPGSRPHYSVFRVDNNISTNQNILDFRNFISSFVFILCRRLETHVIPSQLIRNIIWAISFMET